MYEVRVTPKREAFAIMSTTRAQAYPRPMRDSVFDPYVTTKSEGTGLGPGHRPRRLWSSTGAQSTPCQAHSVARASASASRASPHRRRKRCATRAPRCYA